MSSEKALAVLTRFIRRVPSGGSVLSHAKPIAISNRAFSRDGPVILLVSSTFSPLWTRDKMVCDVVVGEEVTGALVVRALEGDGHRLCRARFRDAEAIQKAIFMSSQ